MMKTDLINNKVYFFETLDDLTEFQKNFLKLLPENSNIRIKSRILCNYLEQSISKYSQLKHELNRKKSIASREKIKNEMQKIRDNVKIYMESFYDFVFMEMLTE